MPLKLLFIHQNFPGQFRHLAPALAAQGHQVLALGMLKGPPVRQWQGVRVFTYQCKRGNTPGLHPWLVDIETKTMRAEACWAAMRALQQQGFEPDAVIGHPGWGEPMFVKQVWPRTQLGLYAEFFYRAEGADMGFDLEFSPADTAADGCRLQMKRLSQLAHLDQADAAISPTRWQADTFPAWWRERITVCHDGIDTDLLCPNPGARFALPGDGAELSRDDELITFVARHLEPYRGFHVFMRALPALLRARPNAQVLVVGDEATGYGSAAPAGTTWKTLFAAEVRGQITDSDWSRVHFLGRIGRSAFTRLLQVSRVHVYLTYPFVLSWSVLEAMSVGACIVASNTAPVREAIADHEQGVLVDFFDGQQLVSTLAQVLDDPTRRQQLGQQARQMARDVYDLKRVCLPGQLNWVLQLAQRDRADRAG